MGAGALDAAWLRPLLRHGSLVAAAVRGHTRGGAFDGGGGSGRVVVCATKRRASDALTTRCATHTRTHTHARTHTHTHTAVAPPPPLPPLPLRRRLRRPLRARRRLGRAARVRERERRVSGSEEEHGVESCVVRNEVCGIEASQSSTIRSGCCSRGIGSRPSFARIGRSAT